MLDIHCHILPGVDDGSPDEQTTMAMAQAARRAGIDRIIATPHASSPEAARRAQQRFEAARAICEREGVRLFRGCELKVSALAEIDEQGLDAAALGAETFLLIEFSSEAPPVGWEFLLSGLTRRGYHPVIAHPERYQFAQRDPSLLEQMLGYGCELQISCESLHGAALIHPERKLARRLLKSGMASYVASDAHRPQHFQVFERVYREFRSDWPKDGLLEDVLK